MLYRNQVAVVENKFTIKKVDGSQWKTGFSDSAHAVCFGVKDRRTLDVIDFALLGFCKEILGGYMTCKVMDSETIYIQYGGVFPEFQKSVYVLAGYRELLAFCFRDYKRVTTKVKASNVSMLKLALKLGFSIIGTMIFKQELYIELMKEA